MESINSTFSHLAWYLFENKKVKGIKIHYGIRVESVTVMVELVFSKVESAIIMVESSIIIIMVESVIIRPSWREASITV